MAKTTESALGVDRFPWTVIESPKKTFYSQSKVAMRVASKDQGGGTYEGPLIVFPTRWQHIEFFYILEPVELGFYLAKSLHDRFHYQIPRNDRQTMDAIINHCNKSKGKSKFKIICKDENFQDDNMLVVHDPSKQLKDYIATINDKSLLSNLINLARYDSIRGNFFVDSGFASAKNQMRDEADFSISKPAKLANTDEPIFLESMIQMSTVTDMLCQEYGLPLLFRVDGIDHQWARTLDPNNILQSIRNSVTQPTSAFGPHLDSQNDPRELMSAVPVFHRILQTDLGPVRHAKIGYSRKACYEAGLRVNLLQPIVDEVATWYHALPSTRKVINNDLFLLPRNDTIDHAIAFPVHCKKSVGLSPFIDGTIKMQQAFELNKEHCVAIAYHIVTSESPYYFWSTVMDYLEIDDMPHIIAIKAWSPLVLSLDFHERMWNKIEDPTIHSVPRRHQPHNNTRPDDFTISESVRALLKMLDAFWKIDESDRKKQYYHSMAVGILSQKTDKGGCHAAGSLTSQGLLHALACLGLIPTGQAHWGEIATNPKYLEELDITIANRKADMFLSTLSHHLKITPCEAEHVNCKYGRSQNNTEGSFTDAIYPGQKVYEIIKDGRLRVFDGTNVEVIDPPARQWRDTFFNRTVEPLYWFSKTKKLVRGGNRIHKNKKARRDEPIPKEIDELPSSQVVFGMNDPVKLNLSLNSLLGFAIGGRPLKVENLIATMCSKGEIGRKYHFSFKDHEGRLIDTEPTDLVYDSMFACKADGVLRYTAKYHREVLSKGIFRLVESPAGKEQCLGRYLEEDQYKNGKRKPDIGFYVFYHIEDSKKARAKGRERILAVAKYVNRDTLVFAIYNENYQTNKMNCYLLHRT